MNSILTKKEFCDVINDLEVLTRYEEKNILERCELDKKLRLCDYDTGLYGCCETFSVVEPLVIFLLTKAMQDKNEWISYFVYELDFGKDYEYGSVTQEIDGQICNVDISTPEKLYNLLTN